jgi:hypothetical protein
MTVISTTKDPENLTLTIVAEFEARERPRRLDARRQCRDVTSDF